MIALSFLNRYWMQIAIFAAIAGVAWWSYDTGYDKADAAWQQKWNAQAKELAEDRAKAEQEQREQEQEWQRKLNQVQANAQQQIESLETDLVAAGTAADGLREQAKRMAERASRSCASSSTGTSGAPTETTSMVLADVLERIDKRAGELAEAYDRSRIAGLACEEAYDSLTNKKPAY